MPRRGEDTPRAPTAAQEAPHPALALPDEGRRRVWIERPTPGIDGGRTPVKRVVGDTVEVEVTLVCDGHDQVAGALVVHPPGGKPPREVGLEPLGNDRFRGRFEVHALGTWRYEVVAWVDAFCTWRHDLARRMEAGQDIHVDLQIGARLVAGAADRAVDEDRRALRAAAALLDDAEVPERDRVRQALDPLLALRMVRWPDRSLASRSAATSPVEVGARDTRFAAWYEFFPRSARGDGVHATLRDAEAMLEHAAELGFDVVYLPPIHPIGTSFRKGPNNALDAGPHDPGSPWAIGGPEGGHTAIHPQLGTLDDFDHFVRRANQLGLEVALDIAFQCSPEHPWVTEHPAWFRQRPDGTIQYAENPPKKYQDVYPFDFETEDWEALWQALRGVFTFWIDRGVRTFRVDNPHTKPLAFWRWCLGSLRAERPDLVFLAEAFTRPRLKYALAKAGFNQGYTYFTWRATPAELRAYVEELTATEVGEFFQPSFWPNTPDILPEDLQIGGRPAFVARAVLAATLSSAWGVYGPAFELMDAVARPGSGEYLDNEKYELKRWDLARADSLAPLLKRLNRIRQAHPALHHTRNVTFHEVDNDRLLAFSKADPHGADDVLIVVVSMDHHHRQSGFIHLDLGALGLDPHAPFQVHDLLGEGRYLWSGPRAYVELDPHALPAQIFRVRRKVRTEQDFDYFL